MDSQFCCCRAPDELERLRALCRSLVSLGTVPEILARVLDGAMLIARARHGAACYAEHEAATAAASSALIAECRERLASGCALPADRCAISLDSSVDRRTGIVLLVIDGRLPDDVEALLAHLGTMASLALERAAALAQAEVRAAESALAQRAEAWRKDAFLAQLAHELRAPLAPLVSATQILRGSAGDPARRGEALEVIQRQAWQMSRLIDDLLDVARVAQGRIKLHRQRVDLRAVARSAAASCRPAIEARRHRFHLALFGPPLVVVADPVRLIQILTNLIENASKYTPPGGEVWLSAESCDDRARCRIRDTGAGFEPDELPRAFELFAQLERGGASEGGLGVGLALARRLAGLFGGTVEGWSAGRDAGSEFVLDLPLAHGRTQSAGARDSALVIDGP